MIPAPAHSPSGSDRSVRDLVYVLAVLAVLFQILLGVVVAHAASAAQDGLPILEICSPSGPTARVHDGAGDPRPDPTRYPHCPACFLGGSHAIQAPDLKTLAPAPRASGAPLRWARHQDRRPLGAAWWINRARAPPPLGRT